ncbi:MAG: YbbR-like domain-containing protein [Thermoplasmata archaeon]|nr:YbbR-like domain-containing protein [Thermoplasmata archaeon]
MHRLTRNLRPKLVTLFLALLTWYLITQETSREERTFSFPIRIVKADEMEMVEVRPQSLEIDIKGPAKALERFEPAAVVLDLSNERSPGRIERQITKRDIPVKRPLSVSGAFSDKIRVTLDLSAEKALPIEVVTKGYPKEGYMIKRLRCVPDVYNLSGPQSVLEKLSTIRTKPVNVSGHSVSFPKKSVELVNPMTGEASGEKVDVTVVIEPNLVVKEFEEVEVKVVISSDASLKVSVAPRFTSVTLKGRSDILKTFDPSWIRAYVTVTDDMTGTDYELPVNLFLTKTDEDINIEKKEPAKVNVKITPVL